MPTLMTHTVVAGAAGLASDPMCLTARFWVVSAFCSTIPDADVLVCVLGIPYGYSFGQGRPFKAGTANGARRDAGKETGIRL